MKNTDPPHRAGHRPPQSNGKARPATFKLTPELNRFIQHMGAYFENSGVPRIGGLILGLMIVADEPLSAEQIASTLKISRASISTNFRVLAAAGMAERFTSHETRTTYYSFPSHGWEQMLRVSEQESLAFKRILQEGLAAAPKSEAVRRRLEAGDKLSDLLLHIFHQAAVEWQARQSRMAA